jgi:hypothetical protein
MIAPPHPMYPDTSHINYYKGEITGSHPSQANPLKDNPLKEEEQK